MQELQKLLLKIYGIYYNITLQLILIMKLVEFLQHVTVLVVLCVP